MRAGLGVRVEQNGFRISRTHFLRPTEQRDEHLECLDDGTSRFSFSFIIYYLQMKLMTVLCFSLGFVAHGLPPSYVSSTT